MKCKKCGEAMECIDIIRGTHDGIVRGRFRPTCNCNIKQEIKNHNNLNKTGG